MRPVVAQVPGIVEAVMVRTGELVRHGQVLLEVRVLEMRQKITTPVAGSIALVWVMPGMQLRVGDVLVEIAPA